MCWKRSTNDWGRELSVKDLEENYLELLKSYIDKKYLLADFLMKQKGDFFLMMIKRMLRRCR